MFKSTKIIELGSCAFRQPQAKSHCQFLHGYRLTAKFWFEANELDENNWVVDFGALKGLKQLLEKQFDHTTCISSSDPHIETFKKLEKLGVCDLRIMDGGVGIEKFAEFCHTAADSYVDELTQGRCKCIMVEVFEHEKNSAIYQTHTTQKIVYKDPEVETVIPPVKDTSRAAPVGNKKQTNKWIDPDSTNSWGL